MRSHDDLIANLESLHADAFGWALHCCGGDRCLAEETLQNAWVKVSAGKTRPGGASQVKTWWFGVIRLTALEELRRERRRTSRLASFVADMLGFQRERMDARDAEIEWSEQTAQLREALAQLPTRQSEVLHLVFYQECTVDEAAAVMGISKGSARQHYDRAKRGLRELLER